jgi:hypothetical protein
MNGIDGSKLHSKAPLLARGHMSSVRLSHTFLQCIVMLFTATSISHLKFLERSTNVVCRSVWPAAAATTESAQSSYAYLYTSCYILSVQQRAAVLLQRAAAAVVQDVDR